MLTMTTATRLGSPVGELLQEVGRSILCLEHRRGAVSEAGVVVHDLAVALGDTYRSRTATLGEITRAAGQISIHLAELVVQGEAESARAGRTAALNPHTTARTTPLSLASTTATRLEDTADTSYRRTGAGQLRTIGQGRTTLQRRARGGGNRMRYINAERSTTLPLSSASTLRLTVSTGHLYLAASKKLLCEATSELSATISHLLNAAVQTTSTRTVFVF